MSVITPGDEIKASYVHKAGFWMDKKKSRKMENKVQVKMHDIGMHQTRLSVQTFLGYWKEQVITEKMLKDW